MRRGTGTPANLVAGRLLTRLPIGRSPARCRRLSSEKSICFAELAKCEAAKAKLEELCRVQTRRHKEALEESSRRLSEEMVKRKALSDQFSGSIEGVSSKIEEQAAASKAAATENDTLRAKLGDLLGRFDEQQAYFDNAIKTKDLEVSSQGGESTGCWGGREPGREDAGLLSRRGHSLTRLRGFSLLACLPLSLASLLIEPGSARRGQTGPLERIG